MPLLRAVLDTNVLVSSFLSELGIPFGLVRAARNGDYELISSDFILGELRNVWTAKLEVDDHEADQRLDWLRTFTRIVSPGISLTVIERKASDNRILECAVTGKADFLVTGDKTDLLPLGEFEGIKIVTPRTFSEELGLRVNPFYGPRS